MMKEVNRFRVFLVTGEINSDFSLKLSYNGDVVKVFPGEYQINLVLTHRFWLCICQPRRMIHLLHLVFSLCSEDSNIYDEQRTAIGDSLFRDYKLHYLNPIIIKKKL